MPKTAHQNRTIRVRFPSAKGQAYSIVLSAGDKNAGRLIAANVPAEQYVIVTDEVVRGLYARGLKDVLSRQSDRPVHILSFPAGERSKSQATVTKLCDWMQKLGCGRGTCVISLGGGVVGDVAGFVASIYMRGVPLVHVPTTLLAMVDSSLGGKTGIDTPYGKNLIGTFWQPKLIFINMNYLKTLPPRQRAHGMAEMLKIFLTSDKQALGRMEKLLEGKNIDPDALAPLIARAAALKAEVTRKDEREDEGRKILNFGHTIGHALEKVSGYRLPHGEAVAFGMVAEAKIAELLGILSAGDRARVEKDVARLGFDRGVVSRLDVGAVVVATRTDKKNKDGKTHFVLLAAPGRVHSVGGKISHPVAPGVIKKALTSIIN